MRVRSGLVAIVLGAAFLPAAATAQSAAQDFSWMFGRGKPLGLSTVISGSMTPSLQVGDRIAEFTLDREPRRGDVLTFTHPRFPDSTPYVKRLIGLPGDRVRMEAGRLYLNGEEIARTFIREVTFLDPLNLDRTFTVSEYHEQLPGEAMPHIIHEVSDEETFDDTPEFTVPAGSLFMMGDNRDMSADSRDPSGHRSFANLRVAGTRYTSRNLPQKQSLPTIGFVPIANLMGRVATVMYSENPCDAALSKAAGAECLEPNANKRF